MFFYYQKYPPATSFTNRWISNVQKHPDPLIAWTIMERRPGRSRWAAAREHISKEANEWSWSKRKKGSERSTHKTLNEFWSWPLAESFFFLYKFRFLCSGGEEMDRRSSSDVLEDFHCDHSESQQNNAGDHDSLSVATDLKSGWSSSPNLIHSVANLKASSRCLSTKSSCSVEKLQKWTLSGKDFGLANRPLSDAFPWV